MAEYRGYKSALACFRANEKKYRGLSRTEFYHADSGLYYKLWKYGQLDLAIPNKKAKPKSEKNLESRLSKDDKKRAQKLEREKRKSYRGFASPLDYFNAHPKKYKGLGRTGLAKADNALYKSLCNYGQLNMAIPIDPAHPKSAKRLYRGFASPLDYYKAHPELHSLGRKALQKADCGLLSSLLTHNQLDEAIPAYRYRGFASPLDYFRAHPELHGLSRKDLEKADGGLFGSLRYHKQLDEAIPNKLHPGRPASPKSDLEDKVGRRESKYRGFASPLEYYKAHPEKFKGLGRGELAKVDNALYNSLRHHGQLDQAIPEKRNRAGEIISVPKTSSDLEKKVGKEAGKPFRDCPSVWDYWLRHSELHRCTRTELSHKDFMVYRGLIDSGMMDEAIPKKASKLPAGENPTDKNDWGQFRDFDSPLDFLLAHNELQGFTRNELKKKDPELYAALWKSRQIGKALPKQAEGWFRGYKSPLDYYKDHSELHGLGRTELRRKDPRLLISLQNRKQIDEALPLKEKNYRGFPSPLDFYKAHSELHDLKRSHLLKKDCGLYYALKHYNQMDEAIPIIPKPQPAESQEKKTSLERRVDRLAEKEAAQNRRAHALSSHFMNPSAKRRASSPKAQGGYKPIFKKDPTSSPELKRTNPFFLNEDDKENLLNYNGKRFRNFPSAVAYYLDNFSRKMDPMKLLGIDRELYHALKVEGSLEKVTVEIDSMGETKPISIRTLHRIAE